jgi:PKD repeat protein
MRATRVRRTALAAAASAALVLVASGNGSGRSTAATGPIPGVTGNPTRFESLTGQHSLVHQAFLAWGQGQSFGAPFVALFKLFGPIPMIELGTLARNGSEAITPAGIAAGRGDSYLVALNKAIAEWGLGIYIRPLAEMNNAGNPYSGYGLAGRPRGAAHSPAIYRKAFARTYVILHGGSAAAVNAKLRALGLPPVSGELDANPFPRLRVLWSPLAGGRPKVPGNAPEAYYPGTTYVDVDGGDIFDEALTDGAPWSEFEALYRLARSHHKPFSIPEWGLLGVDDPVFVKHVCSFLEASPLTEMQAFYNGRPGSRPDIGTKPKSRAAYRACVTPLAGPLPGWAVAPAVTVTALTLTPDQDSGPPPLTVRYSVVAKLSAPVQHWQVFFGDGRQAGGEGPPPTTLSHTYAQDGVYGATLIVYTSPPFSPDAARFLADATVTAGAATKPTVGFKAAPTSGRAPLAVSFQTDLLAPVSSWELVFGDGTSRPGTGAPPHFAGHTYTAAGTYRVVMVLNGPAGAAYVEFADLSVTGPGGTTAPPPTATSTGTVLVNGKPFTGGRIPYGTKVDVSRGTVTLKADTGTLTAYGAGVAAAFVLVRGTDAGKPIVELRLVGGNFSLCGKRKASSVTAGPKPPTTTVRQLWGKGHGRFRTKGRYAAAAVRGTWWLTKDRCDGTLVSVKQGSVRVTDVPKKKTVVVKTGHSYLAKKP